jgi:hypothetical protein
MFHAIKRKYENIRDTRSAASTDIIAKQLAAVDQKLSELEGRASQAGIPREFRQ